MKTFTIDEHDIEPNLDEAIRVTLTLSFPHRKDTFAKGRRWRGNTPLFNAVVTENEIACGYLAVVDRTIRVGDNRIRVAGVGMVSVAPLYRGKRLIDKALTLAMEEAKTRNFDVGLLFTHSPTNKIYLRNNWIELDNTRITRLEDGTEMQMPPKNIAMFHPLNRDDFPKGDINLLGDKW
jgi:predicted acetyltransferase